MEPEQPTNIYHFSVGSATNGVHLSTDIASNDADIIRKIDEFFETWVKSQIAITMLKTRNGLK